MAILSVPPLACARAYNASRELAFPDASFVTYGYGWNERWGTTKSLQSATPTAPIIKKCFQSGRAISIEESARLTHCHVVSTTMVGPKYRRDTGRLPNAMVGTHKIPSQKAQC